LPLHRVVRRCNVLHKVLCAARIPCVACRCEPSSREAAYQQVHGLVAIHCGSIVVYSGSIQTRCTSYFMHCIALYCDVLHKVPSATLKPNSMPLAEFRVLLSGLLTPLLCPPSTGLPPSVISLCILSVSVLQTQGAARPCICIACWQSIIVESTSS
jgi:hypothetical protein